MTYFSTLRFEDQVLSFAKIPNGFEMNSMRTGV